MLYSVKKITCCSERCVAVSMIYQGPFDGRSRVPSPWLLFRSLGCPSIVMVRISEKKTKLSQASSVDPVDEIGYINIPRENTLWFTFQAWYTRTETSNLVSSAQGVSVVISAEESSGKISLYLSTIWHPHSVYVAVLMYLIGVDRTKEYYKNPGMK